MIITLLIRKNSLFMNPDQMKELDFKGHEIGLHYLHPTDIND